MAAIEETATKRTRTKKNRADMAFPTVGFVRIPQILAVFPIGESSWWKGVKEGKYPQPVKLGPRVSAWRAEDIRRLIQEVGE